MTAPDVLVVGDGIVALATARELAARRLRVRVVGRPLPGAASPAAGGLLAPSIGAAGPAVRAFMTSARDAWPIFAEALGVGHVNRLGILEVALDESQLARLADTRPPWAELLDARAVHALEPALAPGVVGALLHRGDGAVDPRGVMSRLRSACADDPRIEHVAALVRRLTIGSGAVRAVDDAGNEHSADVAVLAAGAWAARIDGLPRPIPVTPVRGQMLALAGAEVRHCLTGAGGYVVPIDGETTLVGSTIEHVGFDVATTEEAIAGLRETASTLVPGFAGTLESGRWAGLRPMTPDLLPILGPDPDAPSLLYACGLSKNGILLAPMAARITAALVAGVAQPYDLAPFSVARFAT